MHEAVTERAATRAELTALWLLAAGLCWGAFALTGRAGLNLYDEGYLWYGVLRTLEGAVPIRDFQAYDPGRYYWCAAWAHVFGDGIVGIRAAMTAFQTLGLACGLFAARRLTRRPAALVLIGVLLMAWMFPRFKLIEPSLALISVLLTLRVLETPSRRRHLVLGLALGLTGWFGRNHGLYCGIGQLLALGLLHLRHPGDASSRREAIRCSASWALGILIGYSPLFAMLLSAPGFAESFVASLAQLGPLPTPIPWPWVVISTGSGSLPGALAYVVMALAFPICAWLVWRLPKPELPRRALFVAATCIGLGYVHNATSRAGLMHLAQSIHPMLLMLLAAATMRPRQPAWRAWLLGTAAAAISFGAAVGGFRPQLEALAIWPHDGSRTTTYQVAGESLQLTAALAGQLEQVETTIDSRLRPDEPLLVIPYRATYYPFLGRRSPLWGIFFLRPGQGESDDEIVEQLERKRVDWVLVAEERLSGLPAGFRDTRPRVMQYLRENFSRLRSPGLPEHHHLLRRRSHRAR